MVTVAIVGASSGFGKTMLITFLHQNTNNKHKIVLLSRTDQPQFSAQGIDVRPVDYADHDQLVKGLAGVHTVLSVIGGSPDAIRDAQLALIPASEEAGVKRFAPSEFAIASNEGIDLYAGKEEVWQALKKSRLEYTAFSCGLFMSILATGTPKPMTEIGVREGRATGEKEALAGLRPWNYVVNMRAGTADFPGDGTTPCCWTHMRDIALFVYRALDLQTWPQRLGMRGDVKSFKEIVEICERVQGRKWLTHTNSVDEMQAQIDDPGKAFYNQTRIAIANGAGMVGDELNQAFPDVKPMTCEDFVRQWWSGINLGPAQWSEDSSFM